MLDLDYAGAIVVEGESESGADIFVDILRVFTNIGPVVITKETVLKCEGVHDFELLPDDDSGRAQLEGINAKLT